MFCCKQLLRVCLVCLAIISFTCNTWWVCNRFFQLLMKENINILLFSVGFWKLCHRAPLTSRLYQEHIRIYNLEFSRALDVSLSLKISVICLIRIMSTILGNNSASFAFQPRLGIRPWASDYCWYIFQYFNNMHNLKKLTYVLWQNY